MAKYIVTFTETRTQTVEAPSASEAKHVAHERDWSHGGVKLASAVMAERIHEKFEYRVDVGDDYDTTTDDFELPKDKAMLEQYGAVGYIAERRPLDTEDGEPGEWEQVDSCWGFIAAPGWRDMVRDHLSDEFKDCDF